LKERKLDSVALPARKRSPQKFKQRDLARALRAVAATSKELRGAGLEVARVILEDNRITVSICNQPDSQLSTTWRKGA
jgi:hypothetical protein